MITRIFLNHLSRTVALALLAICALSPSTPAQVWRSAGLTGGDVRALASDPGNSKIVYLGTTDGHIFGSANGGDSWQLLGLVGANSNAVVTALIVDPRDSSRMYASTWTRETSGEAGGVFVSHDRGVTWRESGLGAHAVRALTQSASDPDILIAGALDGVFASRDAGRNWERLTPAGDDELRNFDSLAIDPTNSEIIYAGTFHLPWKTMDAGKHWMPIHSGMIDDSDVLSIAIDATDSQRIFASACSGIYRSNAAGDDWRKIEGIPYSSRRTLVIRQDPAQPATIYAGTTEGLWKSSDAGRTWARISPGDWVINAMIMQPAADSLAPSANSTKPSRILIGTEQQGIVASDDGGAHFSAANDGFFHRRVISVAVDGRTAGSVAAILANAPHAVVVSNDGGSTWRAMDNGIGTQTLVAIFSSPDGWWATLRQGGLAHYEEARKTWQRTGIFRELPGSEQGTDSQSTIVRPVVNQIYISDAGWFAAAEQGLFQSLDSGKTWSSVRFAPSPLPVQSIHVSNDGKKLRIVSSRGMVFSDDAGRSWTWHDLPLESGGVLKLEWPNESTLLAVARTGVYGSRDAGASWTKEQAGLPGGLADEILVQPGLWLVSMAPVGESSGLYVSRDEGASWSHINRRDANSTPDLAGTEFPVLAAAASPERVFAGSASEGLYILDFDHSLAVDEPAPKGAPLQGGH